MAEGLINEADGVIKLVATEDVNKKMSISHIVLTGTAAGSFVFTIGGTEITITTGTADLSKVVPVGRTVNYAKLTSGPTAAILYVFLKRN